MEIKTYVPVNLPSVQPIDIEDVFVNRSVGLIVNPQGEATTGPLEIHIYTLQDAQGNPHIINKIQNGINKNLLVLIDGEMLLLPESVLNLYGSALTLDAILRVRNPHCPGKHETLERTLKIGGPLSNKDLSELLETLSELLPPPAPPQKNGLTHEREFERSYNHKLSPKKKKSNKLQEPKQPVTDGAEPAFAHAEERAISSLQKQARKKEHDLRHSSEEKTERFREREGAWLRFHINGHQRS